MTYNVITGLGGQWGPPNQKWTVRSLFRNKKKLENVARFPVPIGIL